MSEPHAEPPAADVRSFLPRPGEPVDDYAARLRALHHDLTLVLEAVERGLAAAAEAEAEAEAAPAPAAEVRPLRTSRPLEVATEPSRPLPPVPAGPRGSARVEIVSTPATATSGPADSGGAWSGPPEPEGSAPWGGRRAPVGDVARQDRWTGGVLRAGWPRLRARELAREGPRPWEWATAGRLPVARGHRDYGRLVAALGRGVPAPQPRGTAPGRVVGTRVAPKPRHALRQRWPQAAETA